MNSVNLPDEVLNIIFSYLSPKCITTCRAVCSRWQNVVDTYTTTNALWRRHCQNDHRQICDSAYRKSKPGFTWYQLYKSLTLWPKLPEARDCKIEFAATERYHDEIFDFQLLRDGVIGVQTREAIVYYDLSTLQQLHRRDIPGGYTRYCENDDLLILTHKSRLLAISKANKDSISDIIVAIDNVQMFLVVDNVFYYISFSNELYLCKFVDGKFDSTKINTVPSIVISLGYRNGCVYILTCYRSVLMLIGNKFRSMQCVHKNFFLELRKYNFFEQLDSRVFIDWMNIIKKTFPLIWTDVSTIRVYGRIILVGYSWGMLSIFHSPYSDDMIDLLNSEPLKEYQLQCCCKCKILNVDVVEDKDGHKVLVALKNKMVVINIHHNFKTSELDISLDVKSEIDILKVSNICSID